MYMDNDDMTLATEILHELKRSAKRWFIAFIIMLCVEVTTIGGFLWYISLPTDETVSVENDSGNANYVGNDVMGDINNGESDSE